MQLPASRRRMKFFAVHSKPLPQIARDAPSCVPMQLPSEPQQNESLSCRPRSQTATADRAYAPSVRAGAVAREPQKDEFVVLLFTPSNRYRRSRVTRRGARENISAGR
jgi:hypothetical protein